MDQKTIAEELESSLISSLFLGGIGLLLLVCAGLELFHSKRSATIFMLLGMTLYIAGVCAYARYKGRHRLWGLLGFGCVFGLLALKFLPKICRACSQTFSDGRRICPYCQAPGSSFTS